MKLLSRIVEVNPGAEEEVAELRGPGIVYAMYFTVDRPEAGVTLYIDDARIDMYPVILDQLGLVESVSSFLPRVSAWDDSTSTYVIVWDPPAPILFNEARLVARNGGYIDINGYVVQPTGKATIRSLRLYYDEIEVAKP